MTSFTCIHTNDVYQQYKGNICNRAFKCGSELPEYVALILRNGGSQSPDRWLRELRNNQTFAAAFACAPGAVLNVSVVAQTPVTVMFLNVRRILSVCTSACSHHSRIIRNLLGELADKNLMLSEKVSHMGQRTTRAKVMSYLSAQAQKSGAYEFDIPFSRQQLADYLAVERSGLSVELCKMRDEGLLEFHKSHFVLKV